MAYQPDPNNFCKEKSSHGYSHACSNFSTPSGHHQEPSDHLNGPEYFTSYPVHDGHQSSDYICQSRQPFPGLGFDQISSTYTSYSRPSNYGHIAHAPTSTPYYDMPSGACTFSSPLTAQPDSVSLYEKYDNQMIKEGGWSSKKEFMECHDPSVFEPGDFEEASKLLDEYRKVDAQVAGENILSSDTDSDYSHAPVHHWDCSEREEYEGRDYSDFISEVDDEDRVASSGDESGSLSESSVYAAFDQFNGYNEDEQNVQEGSDYSSDADSTDAIEYESEDDSCGSDDNDSNSVDQMVRSCEFGSGDDYDDDDDDDEYW